MTGWVLITLKSEDSMDRNVDIHGYNEHTDFSSLLRVTEAGFHQRVAMNLRQHPPTGHVSGSVRTQITVCGPEHKPRSITEPREGTQMKQSPEAHSLYPHGKNIHLLPGDRDACHYRA
ncbi:hypothetical protein ABG768_009260 [Culter alburnus]|uniref:Uncharacterized protein n=1 Tax=Culter alburnus TaxID=194366 RepID=A0AAW1ZKP6_CULAL